MLPCVLAGGMLGVQINAILPDFFILLILTLLLVYMSVTVVKTSIKKFLAENKQRKAEKLKLQKEQEEAEKEGEGDKEDEKPLEIKNVKSEDLAEEKKGDGFLPPIKNRSSQHSDGLPYNLSQDHDVTEASPQRQPN